MSKTLAVTNQKGGVGKTTTTVNLAAALAATKKRVLLIDLDPQGNATMGCGVDKYAVDATICDLLVDQRSIDEVRCRVEQAGFDLLPSNADTTAAEVGLIGVPEAQLRLRRALAQVRSEYDYILIDCPPALNMLTLNALAAATGVLIPVQCEYYALEGLSALLDTVKRIRESVNPDLQVEGVLRTMYDPRMGLTNDVSAQLAKHFGERLYRTTIPRNVRLAEAPSHGLPVMYYDRGSKGAIAYLALAGELLRRREQQVASQSR